jgi:hypothetical protein
MTTARELLNKVRAREMAKITERREKAKDFCENTLQPTLVEHAENGYTSLTTTLDADLHTNYVVDYLKEYGYQVKLSVSEVNKMTIFWCE